MASIQEYKDKFFAENPGALDQSIDRDLGVAQQTLQTVNQQIAELEALKASLHPEAVGNTDQSAG